MAKRDYYEVLGVARNAPEAEIKKAFRRLARDVHPDVSEAPDAQERFREVALAYEVLSNAETRELYDRYGHEGLRGSPQHDFSSFESIFEVFGDIFGGGGGFGGGGASGRF